MDRCWISAARTSSAPRRVRLVAQVRCEVAWEIPAACPTSVEYRGLCRCEPNDDRVRQELRQRLRDFRLSGVLMTQRLAMRQRETQEILKQNSSIARFVGMLPAGAALV